MSKLKPILLFSDVHIPYHSKVGWELMMRVAEDLRPAIIVSVGDFCDFYAVSSHDKNPHRANQLDMEVAAANAALDELDTLGATQKVYVAGNHGSRLERYLMTKAPELFDFVDLPSLFRLAERGWEYVPYKQHTRVGKLYVTHDVGSAGRYSAYRAMDTFEHSVVTGHSHRLSYVVEGNAVGEAKVSAALGWLGDVEQVEYMSQMKAKTDWALGFGIGYLDPKTNLVYLTPVPIVNGTCVVNGSLYTTHHHTRGKRK